jgi:hypothetical protein
MQHVFAKIFAACEKIFAPQPPATPSFDPLRSLIEPSRAAQRRSIE